ncbi:trihelix transcription factor GTL2 [Diospyros lotus]|uniref:trihelix transcription factor GTL2 n=1 Tax=Diospyros lotus TaxID=55363 RepID=UPI00225A3621|nr:trihelix transcription factor GTL2 [Diospyros lotus]
MFDGVPAEQFYQFIASSSSPQPPPPPPTSSPVPLPFPLLHASPSAFPAGFDDPVPFSPVLQLQQQPNAHLLPQLHHHEDKQSNALLQTGFQLQSSRSISEQIRPWSHDEVLALLRIRSAMERWFPDFTWEHVSGKLAEVGFKRSAETCKEKFAEESRHFSNMAGYSKSYRFLSELEELCHGENVNPHALTEKAQINIVEKFKLPAEEVDQEVAHVSVEGDSRNEVENEWKHREKKRKRRRKLERLKGFCEEIVNQMIARQEELHKKVIEEMMKKDEEEIAREEARKQQEMERMNKEIETRAQERAIAGDRQIKLIEFLNKLLLGSHSNSIDVDLISENLANVSSASFSSTSSSLIQPQNPNVTSTSLTADPNPNLQANVQSTSSSDECLNTRPAIAGNRQEIVVTPSSSPPNIDQNLDSTENERSEGNGKRWPREEVFALINIRCNLLSSGGDQDAKEEAKGGGGGGGGPPLWERISQKMMEMGYKRSAKRCKEKWENMNKYFRKTKDVNKKRSPGSRTCPYFHHLNSLYSQAKQLDSPENHPPPPETRLE